MDHDINPGTDAETQAENSFQSLKDVYAAFLEHGQTADKPKPGMARLFQRWFSYPDPLIGAPVNQAFLEQAASRTQGLADALEKLKDVAAEACDGYAMSAAAMMLSPKPGRSNVGVAAYQLAAEANYQRLIPYLTAAHLQTVRNDYVKNNPRHSMLPRQLELLKRMDAYLANRA